MENQPQFETEKTINNNRRSNSDDIRTFADVPSCQKKSGEVCCSLKAEAQQPAADQYVGILFFESSLS